MAKLIHISALGQVETCALSTQHVRSYDSQVELEIPYYTKEGGAQSVRLLLAKAEALLLAARITNTVAHDL